MKRGVVLQNDKYEYLTGGNFWTKDIDDAWIFDEHEIERSIVPNFMKWDSHPVWAYPAMEKDSVRVISELQRIPFYKVEQGEYDYD